MVYVDTSVLVAYYCPEYSSEVVQKFLVEQVKPAISSLTEVELFSAVARKVRMNELEQLDGNRILSKFLSHLDADYFSLIQVDIRHWRLARSYIGLFNAPLRTLDALHLAITSLEELELVTSDQHLIQSAAILGVNTRILDQ